MDATSRRKSQEVYWQPRSVWITSRCPGCRFATAFRKAAIQSVHGVAGRPPKQVLIEGVRDGGEGLVDCLRALEGMHSCRCRVRGPLGDGMEAEYLSDGETAVIEVAAACGLTLVEASRRDVMKADRIKVKKAYPAYFGTYKEIHKVREWLDGFSNLFCIGRNGQHRYNNMDHSMLTAMEAVRCVKDNLKTKDNVWEVNTEKEYHESK